ncbi:MAG TPA: hypothetical protein VJ965_12760 [Anaerolineales bacterium]|nr:hypothetical protein [Anaerolineales bacterium]
MKLNAYRKKFEKLLLQDYWSTQELAEILQCSPQRVHLLAKTYKWEFLKTSPRMWLRNSLIQDVPVIIQRRLGSAYQATLKKGRQTKFMQEVYDIASEIVSQQDLPLAS